VGALVAGVAAGFGDRGEVRRQILVVRWESGAGTEEPDVDTVAKSIFAIFNSDSRVKWCFQRRRAKVIPPSISISTGPNGVHIGAGGKQRRNNVPVSPNCSHMQRRQAVGGGNPRVRARAYQQVDDRTFRTTDVWMRVTHKHGIKQWRATHAAYAKFFIVRPTQSVHVGSRVQKRRDTGDPYIYVVISLIPL
jgi:hypothetical protein